MDLSNYSISEIVSLYSQSIKELKKRGILRTNNVVGELGEFLVLEYYNKNPKLPNLNIVPVGTKNINAISQSGERYNIKSTTGNTTGVIYGMQPSGSTIQDKPLFEYIVICKLDNEYSLEGIYQLSWDNFMKHRRWHSRMNAWNVAITKSMKADSTVIYEKFFEDSDISTLDSKTEECIDNADVDPVSAIIWNKTETVNHNAVREAVVERLQKYFKCNFVKTSQSRYVSNDNESALFVLSASYSQKNNEYWYSINDENIPWMELYPQCHVAFSLGSPEHVLVFDLDSLKKLLRGCLRTKEDLSKKKKAHYHLSFSVEGSKVYFKKKVPERDYIDVTVFLK